MSLGRDFDVGGLEVAVDDTLLVCRFQSCGDLAGVIEGRFDRDGPSEVNAFHQFHHDCALLDTVNGSDIGVVQRSEHLRFAFDALHADGIFGEGRQEHLDRDIAVKLRISGAVDCAHSALAKLGDDLVVGDLRGGGHVSE